MNKLWLLDHFEKSGVGIDGVAPQARGTLILPQLQSAPKRQSHSLFEEV